MACVQECPAHIDIVDTIIDLRRFLTLSEGTLPSTAPMTLQNIERAGNPWGLAPTERLAWTEGLDVPVLEPGKPVEYLYWVGCSASYDRRNQAIARSVVKILKKAGVSFGVMAEERCHGEVARRLGNEYLYQMLTEENVGNIKQYAFEKVITHCPHCFNTIKNEYPQFDGNFEVLHHSVVIRELFREGRIRRRSRSTRRWPSTTRAISGVTTTSTTRPARRPSTCPVSSWSRCRAAGSGGSAAAAAAGRCGWRPRPRSAST